MGRVLPGRGSDFRTGDDVGDVSDHHGGDCHNDQSLFRIAPSKGGGDET